MTVSLDGPITELFQRAYTRTNLLRCTEQLDSNPVTLRVMNYGSDREPRTRLKFGTLNRGTFEALPSSLSVYRSQRRVEQQKMDYFYNAAYIPQLSVSRGYNKVFSLLASNAKSNQPGHIHFCLRTIRNLLMGFCLSS